MPVNDEKAVINATERILKMNSEERKIMGQHGRKKICKEFNRELVIQAYLKEVQENMGV